MSERTNDTNDANDANDAVHETDELTWLAGGGAMGALIRSMDWSTTPLGPARSWPQSLRTTVSLCLSSTFPILIAWGPERVQIYNDTYRPICGDKHPASMGQRFNECWASALPAVGHVLDRAQAGTGSYIENLRMFLDRNGYLEEAFMTFSFSPIRVESGEVGGLFHPITEVTEKMLNARRSHLLSVLATRLAGAKSNEEIWQRLFEGPADQELDLPFLLFYSVDEAGRARRENASGLANAPALAPNEFAVDDASAPWPLARALEGRAALVDDLAARFGDFTAGPYPEAPARAVLLPVHAAGAPRPLGVLVAGVSSRRALDPAYEAFFELLGSAVTTAATSVRAYEIEQARTAALAEIDRAKTTFFSNVSHEFRTPLTLMLGPLSDALAEAPASGPARERLELAHRNALRLLKLVNALLDFSRVEAGRARARFYPTDLAALTRDVASAFATTMEKAGLAYEVRAEEHLPAVYVDPDLWEKVVLNLLSNAFKFTLAGGVSVALGRDGDSVVLSVRDTGGGIPAGELPRLFERFHRVDGAAGRSFEGTGIGLALLQEIVRMHGGEVSVESAVGVGSTFRVRVPTGRAHLPEAHVSEGPAGDESHGTLRAAYVEEAQRWLPDAPAQQNTVPSGSAGEATVFAQGARPRVVLADDNADMRAYLRSLLAPSCDVRAVADGEAALAEVLSDPPDLVLSDVMMPRLDGFGLLSKLRADPRARGVSVLLLSARAGEEARIEGLRAGADDYLVKPFRARELLTRVEAAVRLARERAERERVLRERADFERQLIGIVSHDLKTPLSAIVLGSSALLQRDNADSRATQVLVRLRNSAERAARMVRDLLDFTQARVGGGIEVRRETLDLAALVHATVDEVESANPERPVTVTVGRVGSVEWDGGRVAQVLTNLLSNAIQYSPAGTPIRLTAHEEAGSVRITVNNAGAPIKPERIATLFEPMQRAVESTASSRHAARSVGLGLYIVRAIVNAHGGSVALTSTERDGTTVVVTMPTGN